MIGGIYWNRYSFELLFIFIAAGALWEFFGLVFPEDYAHRRFRRAAGTALGILPVALMGLVIIHSAFFGWSTPAEMADGHWQKQQEWAGILFAATGLLTMLALALELFLHDKAPASAIGHYLLGFFYIGLPVILLFSLATPAANYAPNRVFGLLWLIWTNDTIAYLVGSQIGKNKLFERISPKKTWEGTVGGVIGAVGMAWALAQSVPDYTLEQWLALGLIAGVLGTIGDLVESLLKRTAGVKDSGALMPGHGGLLDRFDSFIFILPFAWLALALLSGL